MAKGRKAVDPDLLGPVYEYDEDALARVIGLKRGYVQEARERLGEGTFWTISSGAVVYSREGVARLLSELRCPADDAWVEALLAESRVDGEWLGRRTGLRRARVSVLPINTRIVMAMLMDDPNRMTVRVLVGDSALFVPGMEMGVRLVTVPDLYEMVGNKPRARGNW